MARISALFDVTTRTARIDVFVRMDTLWLMMESIAKVINMGEINI